MKSFNAKQYSNTMQPWQADKAAKQAKELKQNRGAKRSVWEGI